MAAMNKQHEAKCYVSGVVDFGDHSERVSDDKAQFWTVYERQQDGTSRSICDCDSRQGADAAAGRFNELIAALEQAQQRIDDEMCRANREHHRGFMMACKHLEEHANVHYADAAEVEIAALRNRVAELEASLLAVKLPGVEKWRSVDAVRAQNAYRVLAINAIRAAGGQVKGE